MKTMSVLAAAASLLAAGPVLAQDARVAIGDLQLSTPAGAAALDARIEAAARRICRNAVRTGSRLSGQVECTAGVRRDVLAQLPAAAREDYVRARRPVTL